MTKIILSVERGSKMDATLLTFEVLDAAALAEIEEAAHVLIDKVDRLAKADAK